MKVIITTLAFLGCASAAVAQDFNFEPALVRSEDGSKTTIGLKYDFKHELHSEQIGGGGVAPGQPVSNFLAEISGSGLITESAKANPENFLNTTFKALGEYQSGGPVEARKWFLTGGLFGSLEADQSFDNQQVVLGVEASIATLGQQDEIGLELFYGEVEPGDDIARKTALGVTTLKNYERLSLEASFQWETQIALVTDIEVNYRWFRETNAPPAIKAAGLDKFDLLTVRLGLPSHWFVAYSEGKLPFDRESDRAFKAGVTFDWDRLRGLLQGLAGE